MIKSSVAFALKGLASRSKTATLLNMISGSITEMMLACPWKHVFLGACTTGWEQWDLYLPSSMKNRNPFWGSSDCSGTEDLMHGGDGGSWKCLTNERWVIGSLGSIIEMSLKMVYRMACGSQKFNPAMLKLPRQVILVRSYCQQHLLFEDLCGYTYTCKCPIVLSSSKLTSNTKERGSHEQ